MHDGDIGLVVDSEELEALASIYREWLPISELPLLCGAVTDTVTAPEGFIDAVYIPVRDNPRRAENATFFAQSVFPEATVYLLPTVEADVPASNPHQRTVLDYKEWAPTHRQSSPLAIESSAWDLPAKRNAAVSHALENDHAVVALIDDDIRKPREGLRDRIHRALLDTPVVSVASEGHLDTSAVGRELLRLTQTRPPWLSGNFAIYDLQRYRPAFAPIYNEDWLDFTMAMEAGLKPTLVQGTIQLGLPPGSDSGRSAMQEPGEIVSDSLLAMLMSNGSLSNCVVSDAYWEHRLQLRRQLLTAALATGLCVTPDVLKEALRRTKQIDSSQISAFVSAWLKSPLCVK